MCRRFFSVKYLYNGGCMTLHYRLMPGLALAGLTVMAGPAIADHHGEEPTAQGGQQEQSQQSSVADDALPGPITSMMQQGLELHGTFDAPGEMEGYALSFDGDPVPVYLLPNGEHAVVGTMIDAAANDLTQDKMYSMVIAPSLEKAWSRLEDATYVAEGSEDAEHTLYTLTDPNCPYCHKMWESTRPMVESGALQVRHLLVGILAQDSAGKAAAIMQADDSEAAMEQHQSSFDAGGIEPVAPAPETETALESNRALFDVVGATGTPMSFYKTADGQIQKIEGYVPEQQLRQRLGLN